MKLCYKISKLRKRKGLSQEELADELEVSRQSVFKWECGENIPDLEKIKKLAKLFNVSFDVLLDDEKDIDFEEKEPAGKPSTHKPIKFRKVFYSGINLNTGNQADYEHGYAGKRKIVGYDFSTNEARHKELIERRHYSKTVRIQHDVLVDFFIDENEKTFGFFFDGAPQFVCPFENLASFSASNSGYHTGYTNSPVVGVGIGRNPSIGVGSMPLSQTRQPLRYDLDISYFGEDGHLHDYKIAFGCKRTFIIYDKTVNSVDEFYLWQNMLSQFTNRKLNEIFTYLNGIKESAALFRNQYVNLPDINIIGCSSAVKAGQDKKKAVYATFYKHIAAAKKRKKKGWIIACIVVAAVIACTVATVLLLK